MASGLRQKLMVPTLRISASVAACVLVLSPNTADNSNVQATDKRIEFGMINPFYYLKISGRRPVPIPDQR